MTHEEILNVVTAHSKGLRVMYAEKHYPDQFVFVVLVNHEFNFEKYLYKVVELTREEITAKWVKDNDVKIGDRVKLDGNSLNYNNSIGTIEEIRFNTIKVRYHDGNYGTWDVEQLQKVTSKIVKFRFEDHELFKDRWVRFKGQTDCFRVVSFGYDGILLCESTGNYSPSYETALGRLEFIDGKPFGKEVWE